MEERCFLLFALFASFAVVPLLKSP